MSSSSHPLAATHLCAQLPPGGSYRSTCDGTSPHFSSVVLRSAHGHTAPTRDRELFVGAQQTELRRPEICCVPSSVVRRKCFTWSFPSDGKKFGVGEEQTRRASNGERLKSAAITNKFIKVFTCFISVVRNQQFDAAEAAWCVHLLYSFNHGKVTWNAIIIFKNAYFS